MKKVIYCLLLICGVLLLSGCGETQEDKDNAKHPEKFVLQYLKENYNIDAKIVSQETRKYTYVSSEYEYEYFKLKYDDISFTAATYWYVSDAIPTRHYIADTDYDDILKERLLNETFRNKNVITEKGEMDLYNFIPNYSFTVYAEPGHIDEIETMIIDMINKNKDLRVGFNLNYNNRSVYINVIGPDTDIETIKSKISELK